VRLAPEGGDASQPGEALAGLSLTVPAGAVELWWPAGAGAQPLYAVTVTFTPGNAAGDAATSVTRRVGFRTVELVTAPADAAAADLLPSELLNGAGAAGDGAGDGAGGVTGDTGGTVFYLRANGVPVYAKVGGGAKSGNGGQG
jgi:beta-galactosidase/beta-glucuronidase